MKEITRFINEELKPRLYNNIPSIFPEMDFKMGKGKWQSKYHIDGTEGTGERSDRSVITESFPYRMYDQSRQESADLITIYQQLHNISEVWEAVNALCRIVGIPEPEYTPEQQARYEESEKGRRTLEESAKRQQTALFSPEGADVLNYLRSRGWTDEDIKTAELGYINTKEAEFIEAQKGVGSGYTLSIPLRSGSRIYGFKFRTIRTDWNGSKYVYMQGTDKKGNLFNLTGIRQNDGRMVVVEGELDALHAQVKGLSGFVATSGGGLTEEYLTAAKNRGINHIVLLPDNDDRGKDFAKKSIEICNKNHVSVLVAEFPKEIKDTDEYLNKYTPEELQALINQAQIGGLFLFYRLLDDISKKNGGDNNLTGYAEAELRRESIKLANSMTNEYDRERILSAYSDSIGQVISEEAIKAVADEERAAEDALKKKQKAEEATRQADSLLRSGRVDEAVEVMREAAAIIKKISNREKYKDLLRIPTRAERIERFKNKPVSLETSYAFTENGTLLPLTIPTGALTIIGAPTSHGKSTFLRNLTLDIAKRYKDSGKSILYFTFEESEEDIEAQMVNTYIGKRLHADSDKHSQVESIADYYRTGIAKYIGGRCADIGRSEFEDKEMEFSTEYLDSGRIRIVNKDYDLEELIDALEVAVEGIPTQAIFIDYIQILRSKKFAKMVRSEQLKEVCISLKDFSVKHKIPIILAAQLTREVKTPLRMNNSQMAESSDIEKAANTIICVWNSNFKADTFSTGQGKEETEELETLKSKGFNLGQAGKLFIKLTKRRGSRGVGMYSILDYQGYSGKVAENYDPQKEEPFQHEIEFKEKPKKPIF